jgi:histidinol phosphatase-like enzyme (inositol monophosphatase family)
MVKWGLRLAQRSGRRFPKADIPHSALRILHLMPSHELSDRLELAIAAAREAGDITLKYFCAEGLQVECKADQSPVTVADRQAEQHLRQRIAAAFPADGILGEELGEQPGTSGYRWILDPIDGTKSFIHGVPLYGTLIGCEYQGRSVLGLIRIPRLDECVYATAGQGAWYTAGNEPPRPARVGGCRRLAEATLCTSDIEGFRVVDRWSAFERLQAAASLVRTWGDCYGYLLAATGRIDLMVDPRMHVWDAAALLPILEEAGGAFTDWQGQPTITGGNGIGGNRELVAEAVAMTRQ